MNFRFKGIGCPEYRSLGPGNPIRRIDIDDKWNDSSYMLYESKSYSDGRRTRTLIKSHRIRFKVETKANLYEVDIFKLITSMSAYNKNLEFINSLLNEISEI